MEWWWPRPSAMSIVWIGGCTLETILEMAPLSKSKETGPQRKTWSSERKLPSTASKSGRRSPPSCQVELASNAEKDGITTLILISTKKNGPSLKTCSWWSYTSTLATSGCRSRSLCPAESTMTSKTGLMPVFVSSKVSMNIWRLTTKNVRKIRRNTTGGSITSLET